MVFATHTKQNTGKHETHIPARQNTRITVLVTCSPAESCSFQLSWTLRKALNYLNLDLWCHLGRCRVSGMTSSCGFRRVRVSHGSWSPLHSSEWLSYLREFKTSGEAYILATGPCSLCCKLWKIYIFSFRRIPKCEKTGKRQNLIWGRFTFAIVIEV